MSILKECKICGKFFETDNKRRLCCEDCSKHYNSRRNEYEKASARNIASYYEPRTVEYDCEVCGKHFRTISKLLFSVTEDDGPKHVFCSASCKAGYQRDHAVCDECGCSLKDRPYNPAEHRHFCSGECRRSYERKAAMQNGTLHNCLRCGREFVKKGGTFCSSECYKKALEDGWRPEKMQKKERTVPVNEHCPVCGVTHTVEYMPGHVRTNPLDMCCSEACRAKYAAFLERKKRKEREEIEEALSKARKDRPKESLCASCRVSYKDCERMQSDFRVLPEGAHYDENGILTVCPKYR